MIRLDLFSLAVKFAAAGRSNGLEVKALKGKDSEYLGRYELELPEASRPTKNSKKTKGAVQLQGPVDQEMRYNRHHESDS